MMAKLDRLKSYQEPEESFRRTEQLMEGGSGGVSKRALTAIHERPHGDTRPLRVADVVRLAGSIAALGLLEPIIIDKRNRLLAGGHRLMACRLLATARDAREDFLRVSCQKGHLSAPLLQAALGLELGTFIPSAVPVAVEDLDAEEEPERALEIEVAENAQRRDYTPDEFFGIYERLLKAGYTDQGRGRPEKGAKSVRPVLAAVIGKSERQVRRLLDRRRNASKAESFVVKVTGDLAVALKARAETRGITPRALVIELLESV